MVKYWKSLPRWVQWVLYLPLVLAGTALGGLVGAMPSIMSGNGFNYSLVPAAFAALTATTAFYWACFYLAPTHKRIAAGTLYTLLSILWLATLIRVTVPWISTGSPPEKAEQVELVQSVVALLLSGFLFIPALLKDTEMEL